ncbi:hypothetical protein AB4Z29_24990 [Paenibacillus sp. 2TAB23]|uniref:hypothetical protein n=1 Tax=Paenibacillus sp. 2TAB23 TaxID=3233004 RepID=UPI003F98A29B
MNQLELTAAKHRIDLMQRHFPKGITPDIIRLLNDVEELLKQAYIAGKQAAEQESTESWSNQSCIGYVLHAAKRISLSDVDIQRLARAMHTAHDTLTLEEASEYYVKSPY